MPKMIKVKLTPDKETNRKALPPEMLEEIEMLQSHFGPMKLTEFKVEQGSEAAERVSRVLAEYNQRTQGDTSS